MADEQKSLKKGPVEKINDINEIIKASTKASKALQPAITAYIGTVVETIKKFAEVDDVTIRKFILSANEPEVKDGKKIEPKSDDPLLVIRVMDSMSQVISKIPKAVQNIASLDFGRKTLNRFKNNVKHLPMMFSTIFKDMINQLKDVLDEDATNLLKMIGGEGDITTKTKQIYSQHEMHEEEKNQKAAPSLLDTFLKLFGMFDSIDKISKTPISLRGIIRFHLTVKAYIHQFSMLVNTLYDGFMKPFFEKFTTDGKLNAGEFKAQWTSFENMIDSISEFVESIDDMIVRSLVKFTIKMAIFGALIRRQLIMFGNGTDKTPGILKLILDLCESDTVKRISAASEKDVIEGVTTVVHSITTMAGELMVFAGFWIRGFAIRLGIASLSASIISLIKLLDTLKNAKDLEKANNTIDIVENVVGGVRSIAMKLIWLAPFAAAAAFACAAIALSFVVIAPVLVMVIGVLTLIAFVIRNTRIGRSMRIISLTVWGMGLIMLSLVIFSLTCLALTETASAIDFNLFFEILIHFTVATAILWILGLAIGSVALYFAIGLGVILATILGMCIIVGALLLFVYVIKTISVVAADINWESVTSIFAGLGQVLTTMFSFLGGALLKAPLVLAMIPLLISFNLMFVNLLAIAGILKAISNMNLDGAAIATGVDTIMSNVKTVVKGVDGMDISRKEGAVARRTVRRVRRIVNQMKELAEALMSIQTIKLDQKVILKTIDDVFAVIFEIEKKITSIHSNIVPETKTDEAGNETIVDKIVRKTRKERRHERQNARHANRMLGRVDSILEEISSIVVGLKSIQNLEINPQDIDVGLQKIFKCVDYVEGKIKDMNTATLSIGSKSVNYRKDWLARVKERKAAKHTDKMMGRVDSILNEIASIVESINAIKDVKIDDEVETNVTNILGATNKIAKLIMGNEVEGAKIKYNSKDFRSKVNYLKNIGEAIKSLALPQQDFENASKLIDQNIKFLDKVDKSKVENLKTTANMFEKMAQFSESINGNFEGLADTLNEKIAPLMEELKGLLEGVQDKVEETGANVSKAAYNSGRNLSEPEMQAQVNSENPKAEAEEKARIVQQRMEEQARAQTNAITSKLDELIELMRSGLVQVRTV